MLSGNNIPGMFRHSGYSFQRVVSFVFGTEGILHHPNWRLRHLRVPVYRFRQFLHASGGGKYSPTSPRQLPVAQGAGQGYLAKRPSEAFRVCRGNVVTTGSFTIPLMKKHRLPPHFAGAVSQHPLEGR